MRNMRTLSALCLLVVVCGCPETPPPLSPEETYRAYLTALRKADRASLQQLTTPEKLRGYDQEHPLLTAREMKLFSPSVHVKHRESGRVVLGISELGGSHLVQGTATLIREEGRWKVARTGYTESPICPID